EGDEGEVEREDGLLGGRHGRGVGSLAAESWRFRPRISSTCPIGWSVARAIASADAPPSASSRIAPNRRPNWAEAADAPEAAGAGPGGGARADGGARPPGGPGAGAPPA